jgi:hypothetical protein
MGLEPIFRVAQIRAIESANAAAPLMERAGLAAATIARDLLAERSPRALVSRARAATEGMRSSSRGS